MRLNNEDTHVLALAGCWALGGVCALPTVQHVARQTLLKRASRLLREVHAAEEVLKTEVGAEGIEVENRLQMNTPRLVCGVRALKKLEVLIYSPQRHTQPGHVHGRALPSS